MSLELRVIDLGKVSYQEAWVVQQRLQEERFRKQRPDTLILVEHPPTVTLGGDEKWNVLKVPRETFAHREIDLVQAKRAGGAAYLGPGQLVGYTIMDIAPYGGVKNFLISVEQAMIQTAADFGIEVRRHDTRNPTKERAYRATWYELEGKFYVLCTKGIGVKMNLRGEEITYRGLRGDLRLRPMITNHGFSLNVGKNHSYFDLIDPCGFPISEIQPISIEEIMGSLPEMQKVKDRVVEHFKQIFGKSNIVYEKVEELAYA
jgi:lipoyl(octanoyl) transferase